MGREVRRVPADWDHPKDDNGSFIPLLEWCDSAEYGEDEMMPKWTEEQKTHLMMYESTSEGTPISPPFEIAEDLAHWLADNDASAFGDMTASYEEWLCTINAGFAVSLVCDEKRVLRSGVKMMCEFKQDNVAQELERRKEDA